MPLSIVGAQGLSKAHALGLPLSSTFKRYRFTILLQRKVASHLAHSGQNLPTKANTVNLAKKSPAEPVQLDAGPSLGPGGIIGPIRLRLGIGEWRRLPPRLPLLPPQLS